MDTHPGEVDPQPGEMDSHPGKVHNEPMEMRPGVVMTATTTARIDFKVPRAF